MDHVEQWLADSAFNKSLGVVAAELSDERVVLELPFDEGNTNPGNVLHGGVAASMIALSAQAMARTALGEDSGPWHTSAVQVTWLAAAREEGITATARLLRKGKELAFVDVAVSSESGRDIARGLVSVRGRMGAAGVELPAAVGDNGAADPGPMGPFISQIPFAARLGMNVEHMVDSCSRIVMPLAQGNLDAGGGVAEGAVLALLDTTGAMAAWATTGPGPHKASTPCMQARVLAPLPAADLVGYGSLSHSDGEIFFTHAEVASVADGRVVAVADVNYRIVVGA
ncbi:MAG TPA: hotdog fold thioesterase [Deltaproteobacteria bacterium]|nr:hotdog fold thioesterase [Candidatus Binatota bacterium]HIL12781.1 hotdog fold thioesterase [Deltaproteobacteria bacterium]